MNVRTRTRSLCLLSMTAALAASLALPGCAVPPGSGTPDKPDSTASDRPTVLAEYEGVVPCADCAGIRMHLTLYTDGAGYRLRETYLGSTLPDSVLDSQGPWATLHGMEGNPDAIVYQLDPGNPELARSFAVLNDGEIQMLDREQRRIESALNYSLLRLPLPPDPLNGKTWMWMALDEGDTRAEIEHPERYTLRTASPGYFAVQADCNQGGGRYRMDGSAIRMGPIAMTFALCAEGSRGEEFARLIGEAVRMEMVGDTVIVGGPGSGIMKMVEVP